MHNKFLISYLLMETEPRDLHNAFKDTLKRNGCSEIIYAYDDAGEKFFAKLPHTTVWCEEDSIEGVMKAMEIAADMILKDAIETEQLSEYSIKKIRDNGGILESVSVTHLMCPINETSVMLVKKGARKGFVQSGISLKECIEYQQNN